MIVKNINYKRQPSCKCCTWLDHWVKICGKPVPENCSEARCLEKPVLGAHVQKDDSSDTNWYIIPLCVKHSIKARFLKIGDTTTFVSAHVNDTCAKQLPIGNAWPHELLATMATSAQASLNFGPDVAESQDWHHHATTRFYRRQREAPEETAALKGS